MRRIFSRLPLMYQTGFQKKSWRSRKISWPTLNVSKNFVTVTKFLNPMSWNFGQTFSVSHSLFTCQDSKFVIQPVMIYSFTLTKLRIIEKIFTSNTWQWMLQKRWHKNIDVDDFSFKNVQCLRTFKYFWDILHLVHFSSSDSYIPRELILQVTAGARDLRNLGSVVKFPAF